MDLFLYFLNGGISFWGIAIPVWSIIYMMKKDCAVKQILFVYGCMLITAIYYCSNLLYNKLFNEDLIYDVIAHIIVFIVDAIMIFLYKKHKIKKDEE